jgi:hypothetical protein
MKFPSLTMLLLAVSLTPGHADASTIYYRDFVIDLSKLTYSLQSFGLFVATRSKVTGQNKE